ncbi:hypothetical protein G9A89_022628 [Geosiphon pyriformis]|nr:hypothetical protein G9A89_022628 [Geosiphon pyriformis]
MDNVFDAIKECHGLESHKKIGPTKDEVNTKYWNITEQLCRNYVLTCPKCNHIQTKEKTPYKIKQSTSTRQFLERFSVSVIDFSRNPQKDQHGTKMSYILLIHDNFTNWTVLRPMTKADMTTIADELLTFVCMKGYPNSFRPEIIQLEITTIASNVTSRLDRTHSRNTIDKAQQKRYKLEDQHYRLLEDATKNMISMLMTEQKHIGNRDPNWVKLLNHAMMEINATNNASTKKSLLKSPPRTTDHPTQNTASSFHCTPAKSIEHGNVTEKSELPITTDSVESLTIEAEPPTQSTLSQIDDLMEDTDFSRQVKQTYCTEILDIRSFFPCKQTSSPLDNSDEVQVVSPPPTQVYDNKIDPPTSTHNSYSVEEAFRLGKTTKVTIDDTVYRLCHPRVVCQRCNEYAPSRTISAAEEPYYELYTQQHRWFFPDIVTTFGILCSHDTHRDDMIYVDSTLPSVSTGSSKTKTESLPKEIRTIISVVFNQRHYAVMRLQLDSKIAYFYDGLAMPLDNWEPHMKFILTRYDIQPEAWKVTAGTGRDGMDDITIKQNDQSNCGPIACMVLWKLFKSEALNLQDIDASDYRHIAIRELKRLLKKHDTSCVLYANKKRVGKEDNSIPYTTKEYSEVAVATSTPTHVAARSQKWTTDHQVTNVEPHHMNCQTPTVTEDPHEVSRWSNDSEDLTAKPTTDNTGRPIPPSQNKNVDSKNSTVDNARSVFNNGLKDCDQPQRNKFSIKSAVPKTPTRKSNRKKTNRNKITDDDAGFDPDNGLYDDDEETPQEKKLISKYSSPQAKSQGDKPSCVPTSDDDEGEREFEDPFDICSAKTKDTAIGKKSATTASPLSLQKRKVQVKRKKHKMAFDGLTSSDDDDETQTTKKPKKGQKPPSFVGGKPNFEKPPNATARKDAANYAGATGITINVASHVHVTANAVIRKPLPTSTPRESDTTTIIRQLPRPLSTRFHGTVISTIRLLGFTATPHAPIHPVVLTDFGLRRTMEDCPGVPRNRDPVM